MGNWDLNEISPTMGFMCRKSTVQCSRVDEQQTLLFVWITFYEFMKNEREVKLFKFDGFIKKFEHPWHKVLLMIKAI